MISHLDKVIIIKTNILLPHAEVHITILFRTFAFLSPIALFLVLFYFIFFS